MTVSQLIEKLQLCNPNAVIVTDKNGDVHTPTDVLGEAIIVAAGVAFQVHDENRGTDYWISQQPWRYEWAGSPLAGVGAVYIGSGESIVGPLWEQK